MFFFGEGRAELSESYEWCTKKKLMLRISRQTSIVASSSAQWFRTLAVLGVTYSW